MDYSKFSGNRGSWVYLPKVGEQDVFDIKRMWFDKADDDRFNFSKQEVVDLPDGSKATKHVTIKNPETNEPFNLQCELSNGKILSVSSFPAFMQVFKKGDVQDGDKIKVSHPAKGQWLVEKIGKGGTAEKKVEEGPEDLPF